MGFRVIWCFSFYGLVTETGTMSFEGRSKNGGNLRISKRLSLNEMRLRTWTEVPIAASKLRIQHFSHSVLVVVLCQKNRTFLSLLNLKEESSLQIGCLKAEI